MRFLIWFIIVAFLLFAGIYLGMEVILPILIGLTLLYFIPVISFIGLYFIGMFFVFIINKLIYRFFHKQLSSSWAFLLPCLAILFCFMLVGGKGSLKYIDPQYYEFKRLCEKETLNIYDEKLFQEAKILKNKEISLVENIEAKLNNDKKIQSIYLNYRQKNIKNNKQQISEWEERKIKWAFIHKYVNDNFDVNTLSNGKKFKIDFLDNLNEFDFYKAKKYSKIHEGQALYYFDNKSQIVIIAETISYIYYMPSFRLELPSDASLGGFKQDYVLCGMNFFDL